MKKLNKSKKNTSLAFPIEAYVVLPKQDKAERKGADLSLFFSELTNLDDHLENCEVFLNKKNVLLHQQFLQNNSLVLKMYLPHAAIVGRSNGFGLKKGFVTKHHIHGFYPHLQKNGLYFENPFFDTKYYPPFMHTHAEVE